MSAAHTDAADSELCPICSEKLLWFGDGPPPGPCDLCRMSLPTCLIEDGDLFVKWAQTTNAPVTVRNSRPATPMQIGNRVLYGRLLRCDYAVVVKIEEQWTTITFHENLLIDDWGNVGRTNSLSHKLDIQK